MKKLERGIGACLVVAALVMFGVSVPSHAVSKAASLSPSLPEWGSAKMGPAGASFKHTVQFKRKPRRGPCIDGDTYDRKQRFCKAADSAAYARGDRAAGRCKPGDRYNPRKKTCRTKDRKTYPADMKLAAALVQSKKTVSERRKMRRDRNARKHGCNPGDGWNNRRKMCVHYYKGKT